MNLENKPTRKTPQNSPNKPTQRTHKITHKKDPHKKPPNRLTKSTHKRVPQKRIAILTHKNDAQHEHTKETHNMDP